MIPNFYALLPLLSVPLLLLAHRSHWRTAIVFSLGMAVGIFFAGVKLQQQNIGFLYAILFLAVGIFPLLLRWEIQKGGRENLTRKIFLQSEISKGEAACGR